MKIQNVLAGMTGAMENRFSAAFSRGSKGFSEVMNHVETAGKSTTDYEAGKKPSVAETSSSQITTSTMEKDGEANLQKTSNKAIDNRKTAVERNSVSDKEKGMVEDKIKEVLRKDLQVTDEELTEAMEILGLSLMDLLEPENLKLFTMQLKGASDIMEVLMDDELSMMLTQVISDMTVEKIAQESGVPIQDIEQLLQKMSNHGVLEAETVSGNEMQSVVPDMEENVQTEAANLENAMTGEAENDKSAVKAENDEAAGKQTTTQAETKSDLPEVSVVKKTTDAEGSLGGQSQGMEQSQGELAENMANNIAASITETVSADGTITMTTVEMRQIVVQIVQQIKVVINPEQTDMYMTLHPEHLGRLQLAVTAKDGVMTASFTVQNEMVKQALEAQMQDLRNAFTEQGLRVEAVEITVSTFEFTQSDQPGENGQPSEQKRQHRNFRDVEELFLDESGFENAEERAAAAISGSGNNVNYTA